MNNADNDQALDSFVKKAAKEGVRAHLFDDFVEHPTFSGTLSVERMPFEENLYSPTPGDPFNLVDQEGNSYYQSGLDLMQDRFRSQIQKTNLDPQLALRVENEIEEFHMRRCTKNAEGLTRLELAAIASPQKMNEWLHASILRYRTGYADLIDNLSILSTFPTMGAIGDIQYTQPFDVEALQLVASTNRQKTISQLNELGIEFTILENEPAIKPAEQDNKVDRHVGYNTLAESLKAAEDRKRNAEASPFLIMKRPLIQLKINNITIQYVESTTTFAAPFSPDLSGVKENKVVLPGTDRAVNLQYITYGTYWRVVAGKNESETMHMVVGSKLGEKATIGEITRSAR